MRNSLVSIIIPVYNGSDFVAEAIQSALDQDYPNIEVIVVNDGSTDKGATDRVCQSFGQKIRYFKKLNGGVATALNLGIKKMKGEYFSWLSHDDVYFANKVSQQIRFLEKYPKSTIAYSNFVIINEKGRLLDKIRIPDFDSSAFAKELMLKSFLHGCTLLIPREIFFSVGDFNPKLITTQDYELWFRMIKKGVKFEKCSEFLVKARSHANQGTHTKHNLHLEEKDNLYKWILEKLPPKLLFGTSANFRLEYANLKAIFDNAGFMKSGSLARKLSLQNSSLADLFLIFALAPIKNFAVKVKKTIFRFYRYAKRRINAFSVTKNEQEGIVNISKICLIGNINSVHNLKLCRYLLSKKFFVYFISNKPGKIKGVISLDLSKKTGELKIIWFMRAILETRRWLRKIKPDVVHCQSLIPAGVWAGLSGFHPYIIWLFGSEIFNFKSYHFLLKLLATYALKNADSITGSSRVLLDESVAKGARAELTKLILNGVDLSVFKPSTKKSQSPLIFCPRAIKPIYQTMTLVKAFERSLEDSPDLKLALIKFNVDELYLKEIKKNLSQRNLTKKVIFLKPAENQQMAKYYQKAEVVVSIPQWDSSSVSFLEGLACNKKMVVSNLPFLQDWSGLKLWKCKVGDIDSTAKAIRLALQSEAVDNRTKIAKEISLENNYKALINLYSDCFKRQR